MRHRLPGDLVRRHDDRHGRVGTRRLRRPDPKGWSGGSKQRRQKQVAASQNELADWLFLQRLSTSASG
jgi:hypothetical protein